MASSVESDNSDVVNIPMKNIIHDTPMMKWSKENASEMVSQVKPKKLPPKKDTIGTLKPEKIDQIQSAYDEGIQHTLPPINVKQYGSTPYYEVIDGRHRSVMALKHGEESIPAKIMEGGRKRRSYPKRYIPTALSKRDKRKQRKMITKSRRMYKKGKYYTRKKLKSFKSKESPHVVKAKRLYKINTISASSNLAKKTQCSIGTLRKIVKKGQGAYFSSGSRPNQTGHSWGRARLASTITGGKAAAVDYKLLEAGCKKGSRALRMAKAARRRHGYGTRRVPKQKGGTRGMKEKILKFEKGPGEKKYTAHIRNNKTKKVRVIHFGHKDYEQYKDRTNKGLYSRRNHGDKRRQQNYYNRHSGEKNRKKAIAKEIRKSNGIYNAKILSHIYLW